MSRPIIEVRNLSKRYRLGTIGATSLREEFHRYMDRLRGVAHPDTKEFWALREVSFDVQVGEVVGVIGRNGAGKSTLLKILSRITEPTSGSARLRGRVASLLEVGTGFHPELTGRENVFLNGAILGMNRAEVRRKLDEIIAFAEVEQFIDTPVKRYSSGMYVRLAFAVAAHLEPEILIVDEVLAVGDVAFQKKCIGKMRDVSTGGRTVMFVSHNLAAVRNLCQSAVWLAQGKVRKQGPVAEVCDAYALEHKTDSGAARLHMAPRHDGHGSRLWITDVVVNKGQPLFHGQAASIEVRFHAAQPIEDVTVGVGFSNLDGTRLLTCESDLPGERFALHHPGDYVIHAHIDPLHLQPGFYQIDVGARAGDFQALDYVAGCVDVEVAAGPTTRPTLVRGEGHVRYPSHWGTPARAS